MKKKLLSLTLATVMAASMFTACGTGEKEADTTKAETQTVQETDTQDTTKEIVVKTSESISEVAEVESQEDEDDLDGTESSDVDGMPTKDRSGNDITVPEHVEKIISMAPSTTQLLIDLGYADQIIACDTYSGYSYGDQLTADIPQFDMMSPDNEQIVALEPDIVFTTGMSYAGGEDVYAAVKAVDVCVADIPSSNSLAEIEEDILFIGACIGAEDAAAEIVEEMEESIEAIKAIAADIPEDEKKTVLYELSTPTPDYPQIYTCGANTYIDEMLTTIGAINVAGEEEDQWPALTEEAAVAANPDVILSGDTYTPDVVNVILNTEGWEAVTAVQEKAVYAVDGDAINRPNQHVVEAMYEMAQWIYPEYFGKMELPFAA